MGSEDMLAGTANGLVGVEMCRYGPERNGILLLPNRGLISELPLKRSPCSVENGFERGLHEKTSLQRKNSFDG